MNSTTLSEVLTLEEVAEYLRLPSEVVLRQAINGKLPGRKIEDHWRFLKSAINAWLSLQPISSSIVEQSIDLASQGINQSEAEVLRASLMTFADDWNSPEMSIYDNYDAAKASLETR
jgi:excisionase family DNA binding protein